MRRKKKKAFVITKFKPKLVFMPPKKFWGKKIFGVILLIFGSAILTATVVWFFIAPAAFQKECPPAPVASQDREVFKKIFIPKIDLDLPISEAKIDAGKWLLPENEAVLFPGTANLEDSGNTVIFGGNLLSSFGNLTQLKKKDRIYLFGEKKFLVFEVLETKSVLPSEASILAKTSERTLTIFSTSDYLKGRRFVVKAKKI